MGRRANSPLRSRRRKDRKPATFRGSIAAQPIFAFPSMSKVFATAALACLLLRPVFAATDKGEDKLPVTTIVIDSAHGPVKFQAEVAADPVSQEKGLMFRKSLAPDAGMLFDFHTPAFQTFWMKNTAIPLDMIFIRADGTISSIAPNATPQSETPIPS